MLVRPARLRYPKNNLRGNVLAVSWEMEPPVSTLNTWIDGLEARVRQGGLLPYALLTVLGLILFAPGITSLPVTDRDEARYVQAARQMHESGEAVAIRFGTEARYHKPVGIYWAQVGARSLWMGVFGEQAEHVWMHRTVTLACMVAMLLALYAFVSRFADPVTGLLTAVITAGCGLMVVEAHVAKTDGALILATVVMQGALGCLYVRWRQDRRLPGKLIAAYWLALGVGILLKGPAIVLIGGLTMLALLVFGRFVSWWRFVLAMRPASGAGLVALLVLPWVIALLSTGEGSAWSAGFWQDLWPKIAGGEGGRSGPPGYHTVLSPLTLWPMGLVILISIPLWPRLAREPAGLFALCWLVPGWIAFELIPQKLPHYILPLVPAAALLTAMAVRRPPLFAEISRAHRFLAWIIPWVWMASGVALALGLLAASVLLDGSAWVVLAAILLVAIMAGALWLAATKVRRFDYAAEVALCLGLLVLTAPLTLAIIVPGLRQAWPAPALAEAVAQVPDAARRPMVLTGYTEPSLSWYLDRQFCRPAPDSPCEPANPVQAQLLRPAEAAAALAALGPGALAVISAEEDGDPLGQPVERSDGPETQVARAATDLSRFLEAALAEGLSLRPMAHVRGLNLTKMENVHAVVFEVQAPGIPFCQQSQPLLAGLPAGDLLVAAQARLCR